MSSGDLLELHTQMRKEAFDKLALTLLGVLVRSRKKS